MAAKKQKPQKRSAPAKGKPAAKKKAAPARPKPRPAAKAVKKSARKPARPIRKTAAKAPAKKKPLKSAAKKTAAKAPAKAAKAPVKKAAPAKAPAKKTPAKAAAPAAPVKTAPVKAAAVKTAPPKAAPPARPAAPAPPAEPVSASPEVQAPAGGPAEVRAPRPERTEGGGRPEGREGRGPRPEGRGPRPEGRGRPEGGPPGDRPRRGRPPKSASQPASEEASIEIDPSTAIGNLPPIRPYRGTQTGTGKKMKPLRVKKSKPRDRFSKLFAEFETKPAPEKKKKRRVVDEDEEETRFSVIRERMRLQVETPEQIRASVLKKFLAGEQPTCPVGCGGIAEIVRVGTLEDGSGEVWIECLSCAQRERFIIPKATAPERQAAQHAMEESGEALCPRHGRPVQVRRRGRDLVCPECGVLFPGG